MLLNPLSYISRYESSNRNVIQGIVPTSVSTAGGYFQITNQTWQDVPADIRQGYPTAISAPYNVQAAAAASLYNSRGFAPWAPYNSNLSNFIQTSGGSSAFVPPGSLSTNPADYPSAPMASATSTFAPSISDNPAFNLGDGSSANFNDHSLGNIPGIDNSNTGFAQAPDGFSSGLSTGGAPNDQQSLTSFDANFQNANSDLTNLQLSPDLANASTAFGGSDLFGGIPGLGNIGGQGNSSTWWQNLLQNITDLSIRGGLGMLALVLIAAAAFAFTMGRGDLRQAAAKSFIK